MLLSPSLSIYLSTDHIVILVHDRTVRQEIFLVANDNNKYQDDIQRKEQLFSRIHFLRSNDDC